MNTKYIDTIFIIEDKVLTRFVMNVNISKEEKIALLNEAINLINKEID